MKTGGNAPGRFWNITKAEEQFFFSPSVIIGFEPRPEVQAQLSLEQTS